MTTDASSNNAEQWHIPPAGDAERPRLGEGMSPVPSYYAPPPLISKSGCDIGPLVAIIDREMQRLRDQLAVERTAATSAREALAACEERLRSEREAARKDVSELADELARVKGDALEAVQLRAQIEQAKTVPPGLVPGSVAAILEAYRLITGVEPQLGREWTGAKTNDAHRDLAGSELLYWLDENVPRRGRP